MIGIIQVISLFYLEIGPRHCQYQVRLGGNNFLPTKISQTGRRLLGGVGGGRLRGVLGSYPAEKLHRDKQKSSNRRREIVEAIQSTLFPVGSRIFDSATV